MELSDALVRRMIAEYSAERGEITRRWIEYCECLAEMGEGECGTEIRSVAPYSRGQYKSDLLACDIKFFGEPDPRTGDQLDNLLRLWCWLSHCWMRLERGGESKQEHDRDQTLAEISRPFRATLAAAYDAIRAMGTPLSFFMPRPPYPDYPEAVARDHLRNMIQWLECEPSVDPAIEQERAARRWVAQKEREEEKERFAHYVNSEKERLYREALRSVSGNIDLPTEILDEKDLADQVRFRLESPTQAALIDYMRDRSSADFADIKHHVHGDSEIGDDAVRKRVSETNKSLAQLKSRLRFRVASGHVVKDIPPK